VVREYARSLQKIVVLSICAKETRTVKGGGYYHVYSAIDTKSFNIQTQKKVYELEESLHKLLRKFEDSMIEVVENVYSEEQRK
jgi:predicted transcriptional regulator